MTAKGLEIAEGELVGVIPLEALVDVGREYLKMPEFEAGQVMETHPLK